MAAYDAAAVAALVRTALKNAPDQRHLRRCLIFDSPGDRVPPGKGRAAAGHAPGGKQQRQRTGGGSEVLIHPSVRGQPGETGKGGEAHGRCHGRARSPTPPLERRAPRLQATPDLGDPGLRSNPQPLHPHGDAVIQPYLTTAQQAGRETPQRLRELLRLDSDRARRRHAILNPDECLRHLATIRAKIPLVPAPAADEGPIEPDEQTRRAHLTALHQEITVETKHWSDLKEARGDKAPATIKERGVAIVPAADGPPPPIQAEPTPAPEATPKPKRNR